MLGIKQVSPFDLHHSKVFHGVRFLLLGFDPLNKSNVMKKLIDGGGVDVGQIGPSCTHVIVHRLVYDDPVCIAARSNGKTLVTDLWVHHSFDVGIPLDITSIMYQPLRDLNGIPGAKSLVICLTGYQSQDRYDIMTMAGLMGVNFSKPLIAHKVTHLICYKFEGEKYELAKKMGIKLVNHRWLEDCLGAWEILPEANYDKSGYELEMMEAEAKDSEEGEGVDSKQHKMGAASIQHLYMLKEETSREPQACFLPKGIEPLENIKCTSGVMEKSTSAQAQNLLEMPSNPYNTTINGTGENDLASSSKYMRTPDFDASKLSSLSYSRKASRRTTPPTYSGQGTAQARNLLEMPSNPYNKTIHGTGDNDLASSSKDKRTPNFDASKLSSISYSRKTSRRTKPPTYSGQGTDNSCSSVKNGNLNSGKAFELSSTQENVKADADCFETSDKGSPVGSKEKQSGTLSEKRKAEVLSGSLKVQKISANTKIHTCEPVDGSTHSSPYKPNETAMLDLVRKSPSTSAMKSSNSSWKSVKHGSPISKNISEIMQEENTEALQTHVKGLKRTTISLKSELGDVDMSNPQPPIIEDQKQQNEAQDIGIQTPCAKKPDVVKSNTNTEIEGVGVSQSEHLAIENDEVDNVMRDILIPSSNKRSGIKKSPCSGNLELQSGAVLESDSKPSEKMSFKKNLGPERSIENGKTRNDSIFLKKNASMNDSLTGTAEIPEIEMATEKADDNSRKFAGSISVCADDETEPQEDNESLNEEKCDKDEGGNIADKIVADEEQLKCRTVQMSVARGKKSQLKKPVFLENQVTEKMTKGKKLSLSKSKKASVPSVLSVCTEKVVLMDDETKYPEQKEEAVGGKKYDEAEANNTTGSEAKGEGQKSQLGESTNTENPVHEKITKNKKRSLSKSKSKTIPFALCASVTTEQGDNKDESTSEDKKEKDKDTENPVLEKITQNKKCSLNKYNSKTIPSVLCITEQGVSKDESASKAKNEKNETGKEAVPCSKNELNTKGAEKENQPIHIGDNKKGESKEQKGKKACKNSKKNNPKAGVLDHLPKEKVPQTEPVWFIMSGHRLQRKEFQQVIKRMKGRVCRDSHQWSYQATHFILPDPIRRTEKFFAAAASGRWILRTDFLTASRQAGKFLSEEPYEWHMNGLSEDGAINLEAPRKWRLLKEKTGHGAFYGMRIIIYGDCIAPPLDTLKRVIKAGDGTILATSPPYTRFLESGIDFAIVSPGMLHVDIWVQEFLRHEIPCIAADYLVDYVCKPGYSLERHVQYNTHVWAEKSLKNLENRLQEIVETEGT